MVILRLFINYIVLYNFISLYFDFVHLRKMQ